MLLCENDAYKCLKNIRNHMKREGLFLLSIFLPMESYGENWLGKETISFETIDSFNNKIIRTTTNLRSNEDKQIIEYSSTYNVIAKNGDIRIFKDIIKNKYYYPEQIKKILEKCGYIIIKEHRSSTDMFLYLQKKD